ncbi:hypothetical protein AA309_20055 [Microvirga vignae]|uniref:GIY-YIG nuclease family protein n=1 Tax=Microvirga vignae TaxID=1225564 RepID=A0A0H1R8A4_9HYPH|nr:GIY-YIG nuclease family protein [Microvirga vignae]KLK91398.1 hypothetical protein AA309_20055 [Microvirga vignae]
MIEIERRQELDTLSASIEAPYNRIAYCANRIGDIRKYGVHGGKIIDAASKLLGWARALTRTRMMMIEERGLWGAAAFLESVYGHDELFRVSSLDRRLLGWVYVARLRDDRDVLKVGFSRNPEARIEKLSQEYGVRLELVSTTPGTMLDEFADHCSRGPSGILGEWFFAPGIKGRTIPDFLLSRAWPTRIGSAA